MTRLSDDQTSASRVRPENGESSPLRRLLQFTVIYGAGEVANNVLAFVLVPVYTRLLSPDQYGVLEVFNRTLEMLNIFAAVGIGMAAMRSYFGKERGEGDASVFSTAMVFAVTNSLWMAVVLSVAAGLISQLLLGSAAYAWLFRLTFSILIFEQGFGMVRTYLKATGRPAAYSLLSVGKYAATMGLIICFLLYLGREVKYVLTATLIANAAFFLPAAFVLLSRIGLRVSWGLLKRMLAFGLPFVPGGLLLFVLNNADRFLLIAMAGQTEAGLYALGYRMALVPVMLLLVPFQAAWGPFMMEKGETAEGPRLFAVILSYLTAVCCFASLLMALFAREVIAIIAAPEYAGAHRVLPPVLLGYTFWVVSIILDAGIYITRRTAWKPLLLAAGAGTNVVLNLLLIPKFGMMGAAYATAAGFFVFVVCTAAVSLRLYPVQYEWGRVLLCIAGAAGLYAVSVVVPLRGSAHLLLRFALAASYFGILRAARFGVGRDLRLVRDWAGRMRGRTSS
ncbi:MAG: oligosaccharide flippase family protein [Candidatus Eisenbacteria bacterium]|nr:oligosaccharide flippase family protein [Candidatus Eisenbacteria bacterium]